MTLPHRIAGGAIVVRGSRILLVRFPNPDGTTSLAAPGGGVLEHESAADAAVRETLEETGLVVTPRQVLLVEDIVSVRAKTCKVWFACEVVSGTVTPTEHARVDGIIEAGWFTRDALDAETVYPCIVKTRDWEAFSRSGYPVEFPPPRKADF